MGIRCVISTNNIYIVGPFLLSCLFQVLDDILETGNYWNLNGLRTSVNDLVSEYSRN